MSLIPQQCKIEQFFGRWETRVEHIACASDLDGCSMRELLELADAETLKLWDGLELGYTDPTGHPLLREAISDQYTATGTSGVTVCGGGAAEALFLVVHALLGSGDHAIVIWPAFESLHRIAPTLGATITPVALDPALNWRLDLDAVRQAIRPETRALFINFPHNPTGAQPTRAEFEALIRLASDAGVVVVSDEVYRYLEHQDAATLPAACDLDERAISLGVMSKTYGLAGLRVGWMATRNHAVTSAVRTMKDYTSVCASAPAEILSIIALRERDHFVVRGRKIILENIAHAESFFDRHPDIFDWRTPTAGLLAFPRLLSPTPVDEFVTELAEQKSVLLLPGTVFDTADNRFRVGLGRTALPAALDLLDSFVTARSG